MVGYSSHCIPSIFPAVNVYSSDPLVLEDNEGKPPCIIGKPSTNRPFSLAMLL